MHILWIMTKKMNLIYLNLLIINPKCSLTLPNNNLDSIQMTQQLVENLFKSFVVAFLTKNFFLIQILITSISEKHLNI